MATAEERMKILKLVQGGKISAEDGVRLIESLNKREESDVPVPPPSVSVPGGMGRFIRVRVTDTSTGKARVNIRLPVSLMSAGMKMGARFNPGVEGLDAQALLLAINSGETGKIVDVFHSDGEEHVEVFIE